MAFLSCEGMGQVKWHGHIFGWVAPGQWSSCLMALVFRFLVVSEQRRWLHKIWGDRSVVGTCHPLLEFPLLYLLLIPATAAATGSAWAPNSSVCLPSCSTRPPCTTVPVPSLRCDLTLHTSSEVNLLLSHGRFQKPRDCWVREEGPCYSRYSRQHGHRFWVCSPCQGDKIAAILSKLVPEHLWESPWETFWRGWDPAWTSEGGPG